MTTIVFNTTNGYELDLLNYDPLITRPLCVFVHGGSWTGGDKIQGHKLLALCEEQGFALASVNYPLVPDVQVEKQIIVIREALRFLRSKRTIYGLDPTRTLLCGYSAGSHLAACVLAATVQGPRTVNDILPVQFVGMDGFAYDLPFAFANATPTQAAQLQYVFGTDPARHNRLSPGVNLAQNLPATLQPPYTITYGSSVIHQADALNTLSLFSAASLPATGVNIGAIPHAGVMDEFDSLTSTLSNAFRAALIAAA